MKKTREINDLYQAQNNSKQNKTNSANIKPKKTPNKKKQKKKNKVKKFIFFATLLLVLLILVLRSQLFNISNITVSNNSKIAAEEIISLSNLQIGQNMFEFNKYKTVEKIKQNAYIESVNIKRNLNCTVEIIVEERIATYQIEINEQYGYINNQGYLLEISSIKLDLPIISGLSNYDLIAGARLQIEDLNKLNDVIQIMNAATSKNLNTKINNIDISNSEDYIIYIESEKKTIHFGNIDNINDKIDWIEYNIQDAAGIEGEFFVENIKKPYFREKVSI